MTAVVCSGCRISLLYWATETSQGGVKRVLTLSVCFSRYYLTVTRLPAALFSALTALASAVVGTQHGHMVLVVSLAASITAGAAAWMASGPYKAFNF